MKIAVIGVGGAGSAACRYLAKAGHPVVGYEQFALGHDRGSSHGASRIIRYTYPERLYTQMMGDAYPLWAELEAEAREELFVRCGGLLIGPPDHPHLAQTRDSLEHAGLFYEQLAPGAVAERFPAFRLAPGEVAVYQKESGFLRASRCVLAQARLARQHGADLREQIPVLEVTPLPDGGTLLRDGNGGEAVYDRVIVTAGAWMTRLLARLRLPLQVERRQIVYLRIARNDPQFAPERFPVWIDADSLYYGFPSDGQNAGVKLASHVLGRVVDPDRDERLPEEEAVSEAVELAGRRFPDLSSTVTHTQVCLYTMTPDEDFLIDTAPEAPNILLVSACSGHGFKFTALLGRIAADWAMGKSYPRDLGRFSLARFASTKRAAAS